MASASVAPFIGIRDEVAALKRERTITVAAELFYERGYENTSLDAIAERMNVTKPFIYAHFTSKAELLAEICSRGIASALAALDDVLRTVPGSPAERLAAVGQRFVTAVLHSQRHIAIFAREEKNLEPADFQRISDMRRNFDGKLVRLLDDGVAAGDFHLPDTRMAALAIRRHGELGLCLVSARRTPHARADKPGANRPDPPHGSRPASHAARRQKQTKIRALETRPWAQRLRQSWIGGRPGSTPALNQAGDRHAAHRHHRVGIAQAGQSSRPATRAKARSGLGSAAA